MQQVTAQKVRARLKKAGFRSAYHWASGKLRGAARLVNAYTWEEGYRVEEEGGTAKVYYQMNIYRADRCREMALKYKEALEQAGFRCYLNGRNEVVIAGVAGSQSNGAGDAGALSLFAAIPAQESASGIRVVHCQEERFDIYIGRSMPSYQLEGSKWQNPYRVQDYARPEDCLRDYEAHVRRRADLMKALGELRGKVVGCWCKKRARPNAPCHGDVLVKLLEEQLSKR